MVMDSSTTAQTATDYVIRQLEHSGTAHRDDFDVPALVAHLHALVEGWDFRLLNRAMFWSLAASYLRT
ncbi:hypothetical protein J2W56_006678 [Nocardia kruczakiae]|uniref:Uncharacterized protein n=1 Tax=Nocardia kruczakiae TaxID=261477 RepID=A0ABU1XQR5_9NOCA|nr:hypothetical protein [Nocardia kruczakiae]MDR7172912.1 hypothetical protein [Nocardia kruczakiae]